METMRLFKPAGYVKYCAAILLLMLVASCAKKDTNAATMPPATQNGSNTMGAYINNVLWVPKVSFNTGISSGCQAPLFSITAVAMLPDGVSRRYININIRDFSGVGVYTLSANDMSGTTGDTGYMDGLGQSNYGSYVTDSLHQGKVFVTHFDNNKHIVSGTFEMKLVNANNPADTVNITSGRFDISFPLSEILL